MTIRLEAGTVTLITGAARGLGRSHAVSFARAGSDLILVDICTDIDLCPYPLGSRAQLASTAAQCRDLGSRVVTAICDVRDLNQVREAVRLGLDAFGRIDVLINNAGIAAPAGRPAHELSEAQWQVVLDVNLNGTWRVSSAVLPQMIAQRSGCIVNISSVAGLVGFRFYANYVASKHAIVGLTRAMAIDSAPFHVRVNAVCPGMVREDAATEGRMLNAVASQLGVSGTDYETLFMQSHLLPQLIDPASVSLACLWLASSAGRDITGAVIPVDAGFVAR